MTTNYFLNCIMGNVFATKTSPVLPDEYYIGLSATEPIVDGSGVTEPAGGNYSRVKLTSLTVPTNGVIKNGADVNFAESTDDWGTMTHYVLFDAATGGNLLMANKMAKPRNIQSESQVCFRAEALTFTLESAG